MPQSPPQARKHPASQEEGGELSKTQSLRKKGSEQLQDTSSEVNLRRQ